MINLAAFSGNARVNTSSPTTQSMTDMEAENIRQLLMTNNRHNVFPNKFDRRKPFRVSAQFDGRWHNYGSFSNVEVATAIGAIIITALYGSAANTGVFDVAVAQNHPEMRDWLEANPDVVAQAEAQERLTH